MTWFDGEISDQRRLVLRLSCYVRTGQKLMAEDFEDIRFEVAYAIANGRLVFHPRQGTFCLTERGRRWLDWESRS